jgi:hypothetical protein
VPTTKELERAAQDAYERAQAAYEEREARREARAPLIRKLNGWTAALAGIAFFLFAWDAVYDWLMHRPFWAPTIGIIVFLGFALKRSWYDSRRFPAMYAWVIAGFVFLGLFAIRTLSDASTYHTANCWEIGSTNRWECAPGSKPHQVLPGYDRINDTETPGHLCDYVDTTSSGGTIWECHDG